MTNLTADNPLAHPAGLTRSESYSELLGRLNAMSVKKQFDPYRDIEWDAPEHRIDREDPRLRLPSDHPLAATAWYRALSPRQQIRFGIESVAQSLKYGIGFEASLSRGLLLFAQGIPNGSPQYRYAMHEVVEEGRHSIMFQELINRLGADPRPISAVEAFVDDLVVRTGKTFPALFFFAVLAGELFIDHQNRELLALDRTQVHPLVRRVVQIHVIEEARHVCFAEQYLREHLPRATTLQRAQMAFLVPAILHQSRDLTLLPNRRLRREFAIPAAAMREAFGPGTRHRTVVSATAKPVFRLLQEHGIV
jgi:hypothetical protein